MSIKSQREVCSEQCTVYSVQCTAYSVQCTVYSIQCNLLINICTSDPLLEVMEAFVAGAGEGTDGVDTVSPLATHCQPGGQW